MQYFKHFGTMRHDIKIKRVISKYGLEGYGLYNLTLESITESLSTQSPMPDLQETCEDIAEFYNGNTAKINEIMNYMINQGLFDLDEMTGRILCTKLYKFLDTSQTRSEEMRKMIKSYKKQSKLLLEDKSDTVSDGQGQSEIVCAESERKEEEEEKKKKEKKKIKEEKYDPSDDFIYFKDDRFKEAWKDFMAVRAKKKASKSDRAIKSIINKLNTFAQYDKEKAIAIIARSADGGWTDIYDIEIKQRNDRSVAEIMEQNRLKGDKPF